MKIPDELLDRIEQLTRDLKPYGESLVIEGANGLVLFVGKNGNFADTFPDATINFNKNGEAHPEVERNGVRYSAVVHKNEVNE